MSNRCKLLRKTLADGGPAALRDNPAAQEHLVVCSDCYTLLEALTEIEAALPALPRIDAPEETIRQLLARPELAEPAAADRPPQMPAGQAQRSSRQLQQHLQGLLQSLLHRIGRPGRSRRLLLQGAATAMAVVVIGLVILPRFLAHRPLQASLDGGAPQRELADQKTAELFEANQAPAEEEQLSRGVPADQAKAAEVRQQRLSAAPAPQPLANGPASVGSALSADEEGKELAGAATIGGMVGPRAEAEAGSYRSNDLPVTASMNVIAPDMGNDLDDFTDEPAATGNKRRDRQLELDAVLEKDARFKKVVAQAPATPGMGDEISDLLPAAREPAEALAEQVRAEELRFGQQRKGDAAAGKRQAAADTAGRNKNEQGLTRDLGSSEARPSRSLADKATEPAAAGPIDTSLARQLLEQRRSLEGLVLKEPRRYWANTYVPGDRQLRRLQSQLQGWSPPLAANGTAIRLHERARPVVQPFDPPEDAALAVFLSADQRGIRARSRLLLQVGLKGTARRSGRRPAMNVGLVLDLSGPMTVEHAAAMRALVQAFAEARDLGDRFSLTVAGRAGGLVVPAGDFRYGPLQVALGELLGKEQPASPGLSLREAFLTATEAVGAADDPGTPLGSSVVVVVTTRPLNGELPALGRLAHRSAVDGVPVSVIGVGSEVHLDELDQLVLAGQGNRRLLQAPAEAAGLVDRELAAVSRVIARAVRLRIRLAPGVQLIDVFGSYRLDEQRAQQVREAEVAIDQRLSRNLGIEADRGLDEEGIQIVIPSFYAEDSHVILLDLVAPGPGPVADVTVRYKDLVQLRNGITRDHLSLGWAEQAAGPLQLNVLKNLLAYRLAITLEQAATALETGQPALARELLTQVQHLLRQLPVLVPGLENDPDLGNDLVLLNEYLALLGAMPGPDQGGNDQAWNHLIDSLRYAGRLKMLRVPEGPAGPDTNQSQGRRP